jgi:hypothetical protein
VEYLNSLDKESITLHNNKEDDVFITVGWKLMDYLEKVNLSFFVLSICFLSYTRIRLFLFGLIKFWYLL